MSILTVVPYYRVIHDDEDDRRDHSYDREFEFGLRWRRPVEDFDDALGVPQLALMIQGRMTLDQLRHGAEISRRRLDWALAYLDDAIRYYDRLQAEPYPGRNAEAAHDLCVLRELVTP